jgi:heat shock protein HslJ
MWNNATMTRSVTTLCLSAVVLALPLALLTVDAATAQSNRRGGKPAETGEGKVAPKQEKQFPLGQSWTAVSLNGKSFGGGTRPSFQIDENLRGTGFSGCNTFSATTYPLREQNFATGPVAVTRKTCEAGASAVERSFLVALRGARTWDVSEGRLIIKGAGGELVFERGI